MVSHQVRHKIPASRALTSQSNKRGTRVTDSTVMPLTRKTSVAHASGDSPAPPQVIEDLSFQPTSGIKRHILTELNETGQQSLDVCMV